MSLPYEIVYQTYLNEPVSSILSYCKTSHFSHHLCKDDTFWREKAIRHLRIPLEYFDPDSGISWPKRYAYAEKIEHHERMEHIHDIFYLSLVNRVKDLNEGEPRLYFSNTITEEDEEENDPSFGILSSDRKLGVIASNDIVGGALLRLIRYYMGEMPITYYNDILSEVNRVSLFNMDRFIKNISNKENITIYSLSDTIPSPYGNITINDVDIFTIKRIMEGI